MGLLKHVQGWPRDRLPEQVSAASYGTVLVLASLALIDPDEVASGLGWELVTAVGLATWLAHLYAEVVGDLLRHAVARARREIKHAMGDGLPILLAALLPAIVLGLGRLDVVAPRVALWASVVVAFLQLVGLGGFVGMTVSGRRVDAWRYMAGTGGFGLVVVVLKIVLGH
jgi:hypothetical protein